MHVLLVAHALPPDTCGGTELYTVRLAEAFAARDRSVTVAAPRGATATVDGATVVSLPDPRPIARPEDGIAVSETGGVVRPEIDDAIDDLLADRDVDLVHLQHFKGLSAEIPTVCSDRGIPCIATLHDFWTLCHRERLRQPDGTRCSGPESLEKCVTCYADLVAQSLAPPSESERNRDEPRGRRGLESAVAGPVARRTRRLGRALAACDRLVSPSRFLRDVFIEFGTDPGRIVHRRNGIRTARFRGRESTFDSGEPLQVGYAGRIAESKGVHLLFEALERVSDAELELHVHGQLDPDADSYHAGLREMAHGRDRIQFHGRYDDAAGIFPHFDVFVLPSLWLENSPLVIQEAFAAGVPVVTGDRGGMAELVAHGLDGLTVPVGDADALAATLRRLATDPALVRRLKRGVEEPTDLATHADELLALYCEQLPTDAIQGPREETSDRGRSFRDR
jgi:glycosyltransferase involved in cell wall biosynthesis